ncbi:hypothetical protein [Methylobacterium nonmethylotrophicum]|uniref:Uncharacterized protein n=1 Tax=Methylobacterium nonmethylotrophicum TaxID=1141884 RepID=A0A4Z0NFV7_9HYPH|nr:hypothetical protein [Methylobacterium nonmethylotrophicum]TGD94646.1 hypothetical protein EU555_31475 [Methylobacterium nonmethylotrophicum]
MLATSTGRQPAGAPLRLHGRPGAGIPIALSLSVGALAFRAADGGIDPAAFAEQASGIGALLLPEAQGFGIAPLHDGIVLIIATGLGPFAPPARWAASRSERRSGRPASPCFCCASASCWSPSWPVRPGRPILDPHAPRTPVERGVSGIAIAGQTARLTAGDTVPVPSGAAHSAVAIAAGALSDVLTPMREDVVAQA